MNSSYVPRIAVAPVVSEVINSDLAAAISSRLPNSPRCALPTVSTTPTCGLAISAKYEMSPTWRAPISTMQYLVDFVQRRIKSGTPSSLFKDSSGATVSPETAKMCFSKSLVVVLPCDPVIPITCKFSNLLRT